MRLDKMDKKKEYIRLVVIFIVFILIIGSFLIYLSIPLLGNKTVVLSTQPVDPLDLIRGQYIVIGYEIGRIPFIDGASEGDSVYVVLEKDSEGIYRYERASLNKPDEMYFIKGEVTRISGESMNVQYGIEQYFFERGGRFEKRGTEVEVKLSDGGVARITKLLNEGEEVEIITRNLSITS